MLYMYVGTLSLLTVFSQHRTPSLNLELKCLSAGPRDLLVSTPNMNGVLGHIVFFCFFFYVNAGDLKSGL